MRTCLDCNQTKPLAEFDARDGLPYAHERCQSCRAARRRGELPASAWPSPESITRTRSKTGPKPKFPPGVRICTDCGGTKPVTEFVPIRKTKTGFCGPCRQCLRRRAWEARHPGRSYEEYLAEKSAIDASPEEDGNGLLIREAIDAIEKGRSMAPASTAVSLKAG
jgi:hypothetical protein